MDTTPPEPLLQRATELHLAGRLAEAEQFYRQILARAPRHAEALHRLGMIAAQVGKMDDAIDLFNRAFTCDPTQPQYLTHLSQALISMGITLGKQGEIDQAISHLKRAVELDPRNPESLVNLSTA